MIVSGKFPAIFQEDRVVEHSKEDVFALSRLVILIQNKKIYFK